MYVNLKSFTLKVRPSTLLLLLRGRDRAPPKASDELQPQEHLREGRQGDARPREALRFRGELMTQLQSLATGGAPLLLCNCSWLPSFPPAPAPSCPPNSWTLPFGLLLCSAPDPAQRPQCRSEFPLLLCSPPASVKYKQEARELSGH